MPDCHVLYSIGKQNLKLGNLIEYKKYVVASFRGFQKQYGDDKAIAMSKIEGIYIDSMIKQNDIQTLKKKKKSVIVYNL